MHGPQKARNLGLRGPQKKGLKGYVGLPKKNYRGVWDPENVEEG